MFIRTTSINMTNCKTLYLRGFVILGQRHGRAVAAEDTARITRIRNDQLVADQEGHNGRASCQDTESNAREVISRRMHKSEARVCVSLTDDLSACKCVFCQRSCTW